MRDPEDIIVAHPRGIARVCKLLVVFVVVGLSLGTGYAASRIWPLPIASDAPPSITVFPAPTPELNREMSASLGEPQRGASDPPSDLAPIGPKSEAAKMAAKSSTNPEAAFGSAFVEPAGDGQDPSKPTLRANADEPRRPVGRRMLRAIHLTRARFARKTSGSVIASQFAPNPQPNQPSRDFMAYRSGN
jgi:hypothetical protein